MEYDVIVVGSGPAGSTCARLLGQTGKRVLLIDKERFPRDKPCGDFLSSRLCERLKRLDVLSAITPHCPIDDLLFSHPAVGPFLIKGSGIPGLMCRRTVLDAALFREAKKHVEVLEGVKIKDLIFEKGRVVGVTSEDKIFRSKIVVGADGANGIVAKKLGVATLDENHNAVSVRTYYAGIQGLTNSVELYFIDEVQPGYFWIFPTDLEKGEANVGLGILSARVRNQNVQLKNLLEKIVKEHPRFAHAVLQQPIKGWSLPFGSKKRPRTFPGALLIGDAAGLIDPMSGEGIENAIRSAECAADAICKDQNYEQSLDRLLQGELRKGYLIQKAGRNPFILRLIFRLLKHSSMARQIIANKFF